MRKLLLASFSIAAVILGVTANQENKFPYMASVQNTENELICGGAIISPRHILTAARCVEGVEIDSLKVHVGSSKFSSGGSFHKVQNVEMPPDYEPHDRFGRDDIAVIWLSEPLSSSDESWKTINVASDDKELGLPATFTGFAKVNHNGTRSEDLLEVQLEIAEPSKCQEIRPMRMSEYFLCLQPIGKIGACRGESAGPLIVNNEVVGFSTLTSVCGATVTLFTKLNKYLEFIEEEITVTTTTEVTTEATTPTTVTTEATTEATTPTTVTTEATTEATTPTTVTTEVTTEATTPTTVTTEATTEATTPTTVTTEATTVVTTPVTVAPTKKPKVIKKPNVIKPPVLVIPPKYSIVDNSAVFVPYPINPNVGGFRNFVPHPIYPVENIFPVYDNYHDNLNVGGYSYYETYPNYPNVGVAPNFEPYPYTQNFFVPLDSADSPFNKNIVLSPVIENYPNNPNVVVSQIPSNYPFISNGEGYPVFSY